MRASVKAVGPGEVEVTYSDGEVRRFQRYCPHQGADLSLGYVDEDDNLRCPWHNYPFGRDGVGPCKAVKALTRKDES